MTNKPTGYLLYEADSYVVIATLESENAKTGNMIQIWILSGHEFPTERWEVWDLAIQATMTAKCRQLRE